VGKGLVRQGKCETLRDVSGKGDEQMEQQVDIRFRLYPEMTKYLDKIAKERAVSRAAVVRSIVVEVIREREKLETYVT
jgi:predicted DNA-binding protein